MKSVSFILALACIMLVPPGRAQSADQHASSASPALTLDEVQRIALAENPEIRLAMRKVRTAESHVPLAGALDDAQLMVKNWGIPLAKPWDFNQAQNMV